MLELYAKPTKGIFNISWVSTIRYFELPSSYVWNIGEDHEELELIYVEKGVFIDDSEDEKVILKAGDVVVYGTGYHHNTHCDGVHSASIFVTTFGCRSKSAKKFEGRHFFNTDFEIKSLISLAINQGVKICDINARYCPMYPDASPHDIHFFKNILECILLKFLGRLTEKVERDEKVFIKSEKQINGLAGEIANYLENNVYSNVSIDDICENFGYSKCHICKTFKAAVNTTVIDYYNSLKIDEAKRLLLETNTTVEDISVMLRYDSPQYFSKVFKKYTNMTPSYFRHKVFKGSVRK